jgi:hypothetical protein
MIHFIIALFRRHRPKRHPDEHLFLYAYVFEDRHLVVKEIPLTLGGTYMAAPFSAVDGQLIHLSIVVKDQHGNVMTPTPAPDSPPVWANTNPTLDVLTIAADGMTGTDQCVVGQSGADTVSLSVVYKGVTHSASMPLTVTLAPPVPTSVDIVAA